MKNYILILCAALLTACGADQSPVRITSTVEDAQSISATYGPFSAEMSADTPLLPAQKGEENEIRIPDDGEVYAVAVRFDDLPAQTRYLILLPGDRLQLSGRLNLDSGNSAVEISGTEMYEALYRDLKSYERQTKAMSALQRRVLSGIELTAGEQLTLDSLTLWASNHTMNYIRNNPSSPVTAYYLMSRMFPDSCYKELYYGVPADVRNGQYKPLYDLLSPEQADN